MKKRAADRSRKSNSVIFISNYFGLDVPILKTKKNTVIYQETLFRSAAKEFSFAITEEGRLKFEIWLSIMKKRMRCTKNPKPDYSNLPAWIVSNDTIFIGPPYILTRYFFQYAFPWNQNETLVFLSFHDQ